MTTKPIAQIVRAAREAAGHTQYSLGKASGVNESTIRTIEAGESSPSILTLQRIFGPIGREVLVEIRPASTARS